MVVIMGQEGGCSDYLVLVSNSDVLRLECGSSCDSNFIMIQHDLAM